MSVITSIKLNIAEKLKKDKNYRERFFRAQAQDNIAMSIRSLREKREKRQVDLAEESKMKQSAISRIEQADYSGWTFTTLFRIADALEARLQVTFEPVEDVIEQYEEKEAVVVIEDSSQFAIMSQSDVSKETVDTETMLSMTSDTSIIPKEATMISAVDSRYATIQ